MKLSLSMQTVDTDEYVAFRTTPLSTPYVQTSRTNSNIRLDHSGNPHQVEWRPPIVYGSPPPGALLPHPHYFQQGYPHPYGHIGPDHQQQMLLPHHAYPHFHAPQLPYGYTFRPRVQQTHQSDQNTQGESYDPRWWYMPLNSVHGPRPLPLPTPQFTPPKWYELPRKQ